MFTKKSAGKWKAYPVDWDNVTMTFGKHAGVRVMDLPIEYIDSLYKKKIPKREAIAIARMEQKGYLKVLRDVERS